MHGLSNKGIAMTYKQAYEYIEECNKLGSVPGLDSIRELCRRLNDPQDGLEFIHIAGTNGKGSTLAYISCILKEAGLKVGRYISPTIREYLERFDIGGRHMSKADFARYVEEVIPVCEAMAGEGLPHPTSFEIETAIAFRYFADKGCDIVLLECGMGGKRDATNIVKTSVMEVFAHIDMDHMQYLGDTIEAIATEKAGIILEGSMVVSGIQSESVHRVLKEEADKHHAGYVSVDGTGIRGIRLNLKGGTFTMDGRRWHTPLIGTHQIYNAALAVKAVKVLGTVREDIAGGCTDEVIQRGLDATVWPGRLQIVSGKPPVLIDGAHNPDAARRLKESIDVLLKGRDRILIMGMLKDKDIEGVADIMCRDARMIFTVTPPDNPRALRSVELAKIVNRYNPAVTSTDSVEEACEMAGLYAGQNDNCVIIAFGSLSFMGKLIDIYSDRGRGRTVI